jgi:Asp/Glu/hydantoin racemase
VRLALINPNTDAAVTQTMCAIAARAGAAQITGFTAPFGAALITNEETLATAAEAVLALAPDLSNFDGIIIAAFGDPGLGALRARLPIPVTGIAEAAMRTAARDGRRFAIATTTPDLRASIISAATAHGDFAGVWITPGDPATLTADRARLIPALHAACTTAVTEGGAQAVIIGGGPLADAAEAMRDTIGVPLIAPIPEAVALALRRHRTTQ